MCKNGTNRENPVFYIGLSSDYMAFFASAINILQTLVVAIGAGLAVWGVINLPAYGRRRGCVNRNTAYPASGRTVLSIEERRTTHVRWHF